ncbi:hypothetical protein [uncultured Planktomarina sp.]|uniref:hypothetical protein n=1 Tax=uncultured Planktomarina sp. TaxID=1538529 RepID=UPI0032603C20
MSTPYGNWQKNIVSLVVWYAQHGRDYYYIIRVAQNFGPKNGWTDETKQFVKLAAKVAVGNSK